MADHPDLALFLAPLRSWAEVHRLDGPIAMLGDKDARLIVYRGIALVRSSRTSVTGRIDVDTLRVDALIGNQSGLEVHADGSVVTYGAANAILGDLRDRYLASDRFRRGSLTADHARNANAPREQASYMERNTARALE